MRFYLQFIAVLILDVASALTARYSFENDSVLFLAFSMLSLAIAGYFFIQLLTQKVTIVVNAAWIALGAINVTVASWLVFGETITVRQTVGMAIVVAGLIVMDIFSRGENVS